MFKDLINKISNEEFSDIVSKSLSINDVAKKLGFKHSPGLASRCRINTRIVQLNLKLGSSISSDNKNDFEKYKFSDGILGLSKHKGDISELSVQLEILKNNIWISKPIGDNCPYDLIMDYNSHLYKIQIKTGCLQQNGSITASLTSSIIGKDKTYSRRKYTKDEVDIFAIHSIEFDTNCYVFNSGDMSSITFRSENFIRNKNENVIEQFSLNRLLESLRLNP